MLLMTGKAVGAATPFRLSARDGRPLTEGIVEIAV
jgi:hypothetical protein